jgi:rubrerythrin
MALTNTRESMRERIEEELSSDLEIIVAADPPEREWQCIECGHVQTAKARPNSCPDCNCVNGDFDPGVHLYIRREACGWFD